MREVYSNYSEKIYCYLRRVHLDVASIYRLQRFLSAAGIFGQDAMVWFILSHIVFVVVACILVAVSWHFHMISATGAWILLLLGLVLGIALPTLLVFFLHYRSQKKVLLAVMTILELVCVASEFGATTDEIINIIAKVMKIVGHEHLASLMQKLAQDLSRLPSRDQAWLRLQAKIPSTEFADMVNLISQSDLHGTEMLITQRKQLESIRALRIQKIDKAADIAKGKIAILFTLTLLPAVIIMLFGTAWLNFKGSDAYRLFNNKEAIKFEKFKKINKFNRR